MEKSQIFLKFFDLIFLIFFGAGSNSTHVAGLDPANPARSLVQTNDLAGEPKALVNMNNAKVIKLPSHSNKTHLQRKKGNERTWCWRRRSRWWCRVSSAGFLFLWPSLCPLSCYWFLVLLPLVLEGGVVERWCCFNSLLVGRSHAGLFLLGLVLGSGEGKVDGDAVLVYWLLVSSSFSLLF